MDYIVMVRNVSKYYGDFKALDNVTLGIRRNEVFALLGPNGAGKTTLLKIIVGILEPSEGEVYIMGEKSIRQKTYRYIGYVPQESIAYRLLTGKENLVFYGRIHGLKGKELKQRVNELLERFGLKEHANRLVSKYSGGMIKKLNIAIALLHDPEILVLDEPTTGLDPSARREFWDLIRELKREGKTVIIATHYMEEAEELGERVAIMDQGKIIALGTPSELKKKYIPEAIIDIETYDQLNNDVVTKVKSLDGVREGLMSDSRKLRLFVETGLTHKLVPRIIELLYSLGYRTRSVLISEPTLEDVFLKLTGRRLSE